MLEQFGVLIITVLVTMAVGKIIAAKTHPSPAFGILLQTVLLSGSAYLLLMYASIGTLSGVVALAFVPVTVNALYLFSRVVRRNRALNGDFGDKARWATELIVEEEDEPFMVATRALPDEDIREVGIIAESKEELRELTLERLDELTENEELPEELQP